MTRSSDPPDWLRGICARFQVAGAGSHVCSQGSMPHASWGPHRRRKQTPRVRQAVTRTRTQHVQQRVFLQGA